MRLPLTILPGDYTIVKLPSGSEIPDWVDRTRFYSITDTGDEYSVICAGEGLPETYPHECSMKIFKVDKQLEFSETGVISSIAAPLAEKKIPIFTISTFNTDYILIKMEHAYDAADVLKDYHDVDYYSW
ncbi:MAG TPA: ACT domain-containing protein [Spirochaetota bacterium]|nr:ACT domain-containing protein [Spirochaetota bacterium]HPF04942.1 ACT domain-containing protein [Spirochaetota bacterium]HPJ40943.1 ACT domain-containing protein [Spirochaetota bacterium]HPR37808.1 ACT domain-containing protein [Spirochaetota bacterium]HRX46173.1 ACT domain-containing protein [Spirochaetota bacterium]